jgi:hypothetical protein
MPETLPSPPFPLCVQRQAAAVGVLLCFFGFGILAFERYVQGFETEAIWVGAEPWLNLQWGTIRNLSRLGGSNGFRDARRLQVNLRRLFWSNFCRRKLPPDLLHKREKIGDTPMVGDPAILDTHDVDRLEMDSAMSWSDAKKGPLVSAVVRLECSHSVAISKLPMDLRMKVREGNTKIGVELSHTGFVGCRPWLRCVVDEIVSE